MRAAPEGIVNRKATLVALSLLGSGLFVVTGQSSAPPAVFTPAQAEAGRAAYAETCGQCHTATLRGRKGDPGELPPIASLSEAYRKFIGPGGRVRPLVGQEFLDHFKTMTAAQFVARMQETVDYFPPARMDDQTTINITAYILQVNGAKAGTQPLTRSTAVLVSDITR
jgi:mono/diheme cytochrome c family protein